MDSELDYKIVIAVLILISGIIFSFLVSILVSNNSFFIITNMGKSLQFIGVVVILISSYRLIKKSYPYPIFYSILNYIKLRFRILFTRNKSDASSRETNSLTPKNEANYVAQTVRELRTNEETIIQLEKLLENEFQELRKELKERDDQINNSPENYRKEIISRLVDLDKQVNITLFENSLWPLVGAVWVLSGYVLTNFTYYIYHILRILKVTT
jgi:hypothetical protein